MHLAERLSLTAFGPPLMETTCAGVSRDKNTNGRIRLRDSKGKMYRPVEVAGIKIYKAIYTGIPPDTVSHEFGHSLGLDDEYPQSQSYPPQQDCEKLSGFLISHDDGTTNNHLSYVMCSDYQGDEPQDVKSVYMWLITQRYSVGKPIAHCKQDSQCEPNQYCKKPMLGLKAIGDSCTEDHQCGGAAVCKPKPFGRCIVGGSKAMGESCINNPECATGMCDRDVCVCARDSHCSGGQYCDTGTATIGANRCVSPPAAGQRLHARRPMQLQLLQGARLQAAVPPHRQVQLMASSQASARYVLRCGSGVKGPKPRSQSRALPRGNPGQVLLAGRDLRRRYLSSRRSCMRSKSPPRTRSSLPVRQPSWASRTSGEGSAR
jgi:hypothetical protein